jgi:outer membrane lipoprotein-sorting protein
MLRTVLALLCLLLAAPAASAISPGETDPRKIMDALESQPDLDRVTSRMALKVMDGAGRERTRVIQSRSMLFDGGRKQLVLFEQPADVRNTGLLSIDYDDGAKDDDQWLYLPSLKKSTRISSSGKSGSFMGTDLSYSDMTSQDPESFDYALVAASQTVDGDDCWVIEARPRTAKAKKETGYVKSHFWVSKSKMMPVQIKNWVKKGKKLKFIKFGDYKKIGSIWTAQKILAQTKRGAKVESKTVMVFKDIQADQPSVTESQFTQRSLEQGL